MRKIKDNFSLRNCKENYCKCEKFDKEKEGKK